MPKDQPLDLLKSDGHQNNPDVVLIYSGGMDSTVLLYDLAKNFRVHALSIDYGQRHIKEIEAARAICHGTTASHRVVRLGALRELLKGTCLTDNATEVPEGHYAEESMKKTVVPNRNMIMLAVAAGYAMSIKAGSVAFAAHAGDHAIYPDCRPEFGEAMQQVFKLADWHTLKLMRPYIQKTKTDLVKIGTALGVPFAKTWSCYKGGKVHCGKCGTCVERKEAFHDAGIEDPTEYETDKPFGV